MLYKAFFPLVAAATFMFAGCGNTSHTTPTLVQRCKPRFEQKELPGGTFAVGEHVPTFRADISISDECRSYDTTPLYVIVGVRLALDGTVLDGIANNTDMTITYSSSEVPLVGPSGMVILCSSPGECRRPFAKTWYEFGRYAFAAGSRSPVVLQTRIDHGLGGTFEMKVMWEYYWLWNGSRDTIWGENEPHHALDEVMSATPVLFEGTCSGTC